MERVKIIFVIVVIGIFANFTWAWADQVDDLNRMIREKGHSWQAGNTSVAELQLIEKRNRMGLIGESVFHPVPKPDEPLGATPSQMDWRNLNGNNYVTPVKNQGNCGSCWAFASVAAQESMIARYHGLGNPGIDFSEQLMVSCNDDNFGCDGGYLDTAAEYLHETGTISEACFPYDWTEPSCGEQCSTWESQLVTTGGWQWVGSTDDAIEQALQTAPVVVGMSVYDDFMYYQSGIYEHTSGQYLGGHAVLIIGYDKAGDYWIVKNSWGTNWGEGGFFKIKRGDSDIGFQAVRFVDNDDWQDLNIDFYVDGEGDPTNDGEEEDEENNEENDEEESEDEEDENNEEEGDEENPENDEDDQNDSTDDDHDDKCYDVMNATYNECDFSFLDGGTRLSGDMGYTYCIDDQGPWECIFECYDHSDVESCSDFEACLDQRCDIQVQHDHETDDDDSGSDEDDADSAWDELKDSFLGCGN